MHALPLKDFRARRVVLDDDDFALVPKKRPKVRKKKVSEKTWHSIVGLPDDVSIRTSDRYGQYLKRMDDAHAEIVYVMSDVHASGMEPGVSPICTALLDVADELNASIYAALTGYYRTAYSALRNILETMTIGGWLELTSDTARFRRWQSGEDISFNEACQGAARTPKMSALAARLSTSVSDDLFRQAQPGVQAGYARRLYKELSNYVHGRPGYSEADLRQSNGPIFVPQAFGTWLRLAGASVCLADCFAGVACPAVATARSAQLKRRRRLYRRMLYLVPSGTDGEALLEALGRVL